MLSRVACHRHCDVAACFARGNATASEARGNGQHAQKDPGARQHPEVDAEAASWPPQADARSATPQMGSFQRAGWWRWVDLNHRLRGYEPRALTN